MPRFREELLKIKDTKEVEVTRRNKSKSTPLISMVTQHNIEIERITIWDNVHIISENSNSRKQKGLVIHRESDENRLNYNAGNIQWKLVRNLTNETPGNSQLAATIITQSYICTSTLTQTLVTLVCQLLGKRYRNRNNETIYVVENVLKNNWFPKCANTKNKFSCVLG